MKNNRSCLFIFLSLAQAASTFVLPSAAADFEDHTIRPGLGLGAVKLGMTEAQVKKTAGNMDGSYKLPDGMKVDYAIWKERDPQQSPRLCFFFDIKDKLVQINSAAPVPATVEGISNKSTLAEIRAKYKNLQCYEYLVKDARIRYFDDTAKGIAFEFTGAADSKIEKLYAIIVHLPGQKVLAEMDERPVKVMSKLSDD